MGKMTGDTFMQRFEQQLAHQSGIHHWIIALSGGLDSMVLLELASRCLPAEQLTVLHINHQLQREAGEWQLFCARQAEQRGLAFHAETVCLQPGSVETAARNARYEVFEQVSSRNTCVLLAHHRDDQAETLLFRLFRGAGVRGMAAMPRQRALGEGLLFRPLLDISRNELAEWAQEEGLCWVEDPSNRDLQYDRNFLRQQVLPLLAGRWSGVSARLQTAAGHLADAEALLEEFAQSDLQNCLAENSLQADKLQLLSERRQANLLRYWCRCAGVQLTAAQLDSLRTLMTVAGDRQPELILGDRIIRRYRNRLFIEAMMSCPPWSALLVDVLAAPERYPGGRLLLKTESAASPDRWLAGVSVRNRREGDRCHPSGRPGKSLKHLFQEAGVPPWQRDHWPVCVRGDEIVAVPGICICQSWCEAENKPPFWLDWQPAALFAGSDSGTL